MSKKGHHGGAWKVAYADFVTAMMALFLVLWLTAQDERIKEAIERAFRHPFSNLNEAKGIIPNKESKTIDQASKGQFSDAAVIELSAMLKQLQQSLMTSMDEDMKSSVEMELVQEGIKISVFDRARRPVFEPQSAEFTPYGSWVLEVLAWPISEYKQYAIELEGHAESGAPPLREQYDNWELTADRANAARRKLLDHGVLASQIRKVAGYADTEPLPNHAPDDEVNRRVTVLLKVRNVQPAG